MEEKNELAINNNSALTLVDEMERNTKEVFCSMEGNTMEEKKKIFNAMSKCDFRVADRLNTPIALNDVIIQKYTSVNDETGEVTEKKRIILIDKDGVTYASASNGLYNSLLRLFAIIGMPNTWTEPINIEVIESETKNKTKTYEIKTID